VHQNPVWLFPKRKRGLQGSRSATSPLEKGRDGTSREAALGYRGGVQVTMHKVVEACGINKKITPHCLRYSYATHRIEAGVDLLEVQKILGHRSILTTSRYTQLTSHAANNAGEDISGYCNHQCTAYSEYIFYCHHELLLRHMVFPDYCKVMFVALGCVMFDHCRGYCQE